METKEKGTSKRAKQQQQQNDDNNSNNNINNNNDMRCKCNPHEVVDRRRSDRLKTFFFFKFFTEFLMTFLYWLLCVTGFTGFSFCRVGCRFHPSSRSFFFCSISLQRMRNANERRQKSVTDGFVNELSYKDLFLFIFLFIFRPPHYVSLSSVVGADEWAAGLKKKQKKNAFRNVDELREWAWPLPSTEFRSTGVNGGVEAAGSKLKKERRSFFLF